MKTLKHILWYLFYVGLIAIGCYYVQQEQVEERAFGLFYIIINSFSLYMHINNRE